MDEGSPDWVANDPARRTLLRSALGAALEAADPEAAVLRALGRSGSELAFQGDVVDLGSIERIFVVGFGKASVAMARAVEARLQDRPVEGLLVTDQDQPASGRLAVRVAGHPISDGHSVQAAEELLRLVEKAGPADLVICLISGGGSALIEAPPAGVSLDDLVATNELLLRSGAPIGEVNTVRKHLSAVKGGRLAGAVAPARLFTLVLSDVVGNELGAIASGPTVSDPTTYADALAVVDRWNLTEFVPTRIQEHLAAGAHGRLPETPKTPATKQTIGIVAGGEQAAEATRSWAAGAGIRTRVVTTRLEGEARKCAQWCLEHTDGDPDHRLLVFAGETTVKVIGAGKGGRNQEAALAAAVELAGRRDLVFMACATDGVDGPTAAAGGVVDGETLSRGGALGLDAEDHLARNDSYPYLRAVGDQIVLGPTGTNVGDVWFVLRGHTG
ncbi:MAG: glycerate kinase [Acidimicrobiia bacterium]